MYELGGSTSGGSTGAISGLKSTGGGSDLLCCATAGVTLSRRTSRTRFMGGFLGGRIQPTQHHVSRAAHRLPANRSRDYARKSRRPGCRFGSRKYGSDRG